MLLHYNLIGASYQRCGGFLGLSQLMVSNIGQFWYISAWYLIWYLLYNISSIGADISDINIRYCRYWN